jgi:hypothetical protein
MRRVPDSSFHLVILSEAKDLPAARAEGVAEVPPTPSPHRGEGSTTGADAPPLSHSWERGPGGEGPCRHQRSGFAEGNGEPRMNWGLTQWARGTSTPVRPATGADGAGARDVASWRASI